MRLKYPNGFKQNKVTIFVFVCVFAYLFYIDLNINKMFFNYNTFK